MKGKQFTVPSTGSPLKIADQGESGEDVWVTVHNKGAASVFLGGSTVANSGASAGYELEAGVIVPVHLVGGDTLFAFAASTTQRVDVLAPGPGL